MKIFIEGFAIPLLSTLLGMMIVELIRRIVSK